ncbi:lipase [Enterococcus hirae]|uniref:lipase n=1 Tax=Enterococcus hirae TaxID=1354 RepID=UPI001A95A23E|nr:lipase [Enterococcus hirae]MBO1102693.1 lipase [Enterococcus hirae]
MTITDKNYKDLSKKVYQIDPKHSDYNSNLKEWAIRNFGGTEFQILKIKENSKTDGLQAMAVAPLDEKGHVDTSQVVIAYAGTNGVKDLETDLRTIGGFFDKTASPGFSFTPSQARISGQLTSAIEFAQEVKQDYGHAEISTTGHSLGEYLALYIAAENQWKNVGFNGPDPYEILSPRARKWLKENPTMVTNYRNRGDVLIGNLMGNGTGAEIKISMEMGLTSLLEYHDLDEWQFDKNGCLIIPKNDYNVTASLQQKERQTMRDFSDNLKTLKEWEKKLTASSGGLSSNERIFLNDCQARIVVETARRNAKNAMEQLIRIHQKSIERLEENWRDGLRRAAQAAPSLNSWEVREALAEVGVTEQTFVVQPREQYLQQIHQARQLGEQYDTLAQEITNKINELVARDRELANQLKV